MFDRLQRRTVGIKEHTRYALKCYTALDVFVKEQGRFEEWKDCVDATNVVEALCEMGRVDAGNLFHVGRALDGLEKAHALPCGEKRVAADELDSLRTVVTIYDDMLGKLSQGTIAEAQAAVVMKIVQQKENPGNGVRVIE